MTKMTKEKNGKVGNKGRRFEVGSSKTADGPPPQRGRREKEKLEKKRCTETTREARKKHAILVSEGSTDGNEEMDARPQFQVELVVQLPLLVGSAKEKRLDDAF